MTIKEEEVLKQWLNEQLKTGLIINHGIKVKICNTMLLYSKERQITMTSSGLQETKLSHNKRQDTTTLDRRSNQQIEGSKVL